MKLIGIIGKSGSGKTTLSKMLERDNNVGVIHLDDMAEKIKKRMPNSIINKEEMQSNEQGEEFMLLNERYRKIRNIIIKNKFLNKLYFGMLHLPKEILIKKSINQEKQQGKDFVIVEGDTLANFTIYNKFNYLIQIDAPFLEREKRVIQRKDAFFDKDSMLKRDSDFEKADKRGRKKGKIIDEVIQNIGTKEDLQKIADRIYNEQISGKSTKNNRAMIEKYGGYKSKIVSLKKNVTRENKIEKDDPSR